MRMILCKSCGEYMAGNKLPDNFRDKCQVCGKIRVCSPWDVPTEDTEEDP